MLHTVLRRRANGESVEQIQPDLIIAAGKRKGQALSVASIYRALADHEKRKAYPEAVEAAHADFADLQDGVWPKRLGTAGRTWRADASGRAGRGWRLAQLRGHDAIPSVRPRLERRVSG
ncbi:hypothetical protein ACFWUW_30580 [Streptomyces sp. NPDC058655]|uniref:hypothetical protein n=1 Tax=Streptomyces sp. NPDC058655 TaxID=3346577 RepID=UPI00364CFBD3